MEELFKQYGTTIMTCISVITLMGCTVFIDKGFADSLTTKIETHANKQLERISPNVNTAMTDEEKQMVTVDNKKLQDLIETSQNSIKGIDRVEKFESVTDDTWTDVGKNKGSVYAKTESNRLKIISVNGKVAFDNLFRMFWHCENLTDISGLVDWDVSNVTDMNGIFTKCKKLDDISSLKDWDVRNVTNMRYMFSECGKLSDISSLKDWDVSNVTDMMYMFNSCYKLEDISPLKNWNVSNVKNVEYMFSGCISFKDATPLKDWNLNNAYPYGIFNETNLNQESKDLMKKLLRKNNHEGQSYIAVAF